MSVALLSLITVGCSSKPNENTRPRRNRIGKQALNKAGQKPKARNKRAPMLLPDQQKQEKFSALHILITYKGIGGDAQNSTRTKAQALAMAKEAYKKIENGVSFATVVREYSDCPSKEAGGDLGTFSPLDMTPAFSKTLLSLAEGQVSEPVEGPFGYHIIKRKGLAKIYTRHILVTHKGSANKPQAVKRTKADAIKRIEEVAKMLKAPDADFAALAKKYSDCPSKKCGGNLEALTASGWAPQFEKTAFQLKEYEISGIVQTRFGYHIIQRIP